MSCHCCLYHRVSLSHHPSLSACVSACISFPPLLLLLLLLLFSPCFSLMSGVSVAVRGSLISLYLCLQTLTTLKREREDFVSPSPSFFFCFQRATASGFPSSLFPSRFLWPTFHMQPTLFFLQSFFGSRTNLKNQTGFPCRA